MVVAADAANFIMPPLAALSTHKRQVIWQRSSPPCYLPTPFPGVGGERSETEGGGWMGHSVARGSKGSEGKVLKMDRPLAGGFLSLTGLWPEGCGIARRAMSIKSALRDWLSVSYSMISTLVIGSLRSPPPILAAPDCPLCRGQNKTPRNILFINGSTVSTGYSATVEVLHRTSKWGEVRRLACPLGRFPFATPPNCGGKVVATATKGGKRRNGT